RRGPIADPRPPRSRRIRQAGRESQARPTIAPDTGAPMASAPSFDIVSKVDRQEVDNALNQAEKELGTRFDFRGTGAEIKWSGESAVAVQAETEDRVRAALE